MDLLIGMFLILVGGVIYFIPSIISKRNYYSNFGDVFLLNLFLGWTIAGWIVALMWSLERKK